MTNLTVSSDHFDPSVYWPRALRRCVLRALFGSGSSTAMEVLLKCIPHPTATYIMRAFSRGPRKTIPDGVDRWR